MEEKSGRVSLPLCAVHEAVVTLSDTGEASVANHCTGVYPADPGLAPTIRSEIILYLPEDGLDDPEMVECATLADLMIHLSGVAEVRSYDPDCIRTLTALTSGRLDDQELARS